MDAVVSITTNDDERPDPAVEEEVVQSLLTAAASDCKVLAAQVSTRLSVPDARVKIKTLQLILNCLTSKHRTVVRDQITNRPTEIRLLRRYHVWNHNDGSVRWLHRPLIQYRWYMSCDVCLARIQSFGQPFRHRHKSLLARCNSSSASLIRSLATSLGTSFAVAQQRSQIC
eukprot:COSAG02_NODE_2255_length_9345_cov_3.269414_5_plen_171_part_00